VAALLDAVLALKPGDIAAVTVTTDGAQRTVPVTFQHLKAG
jgi:hypothetical protein